MKRRIYLNITYERNKKTKGYILDISKFGMGAAVSAKIKKDTPVKISPDLDGLISLKGRVVRIAKMRKKSYNHKIGIKFISLNKAQKKVLEDFLYKLDRRKFLRLRFSLAR